MKTRHEILEFIFGDYLESLVQDTAPSEFDVIRRWITVYDEERGKDFHMHKETKNLIIAKLSNEIISCSSSFLGNEENVKQCLLSLIERAESIGRHCDR